MPSITFSEQALKTWIHKYRSGGHDTQQIGSAASLEAKYGYILRQPPYSDAVTARLLFRLLRENLPQEHITEGVCKTWMAKYWIQLRVSAESTAELEKIWRRCAASAG